MNDHDSRLSTVAGTASTGVLFIMLTLLALYPLWCAPGRLAALPAKDPLLNCWIITSTLENIEHHRPLPDGGIFHPSAGTLTYSEHLLGFLPVSWPLTRIVENSLITVNILTILTFPLAGLFMFLLVKHLTGDYRASLIAGAIFAFAPYRMAHLMHLNLLSVHWIPLILLFWHRGLSSRKPIDYGAFTVFMVLEGLCCVQYGIYLLFLLPLMTVFFLAREKKLTRGSERFHWLAIFAITVAILFPFFIPYTATLRKLGVINTTFPNWSASVLSFLTPSPDIHIWRWLNTLFSRGQDPETFLFPGLLALYLAWAGIRLFVNDSGAETHCDAASTAGGKPLLRVLEALMALTLMAIIAVAVTGGVKFNIGQIPVSIRSVSPLSTLLLALVMLRIFLDRNIPAAFLGALRRLPFEPSVYLIFVLTGVFFSFYGPFVLLGMAVPPFASLRVSARFFSVALIGLSVLSGYGSSFILEKAPDRRRKLALTALLLGITMVESLSIPLPLASILPPEPLYSEVRNLPADSVLLELPCEGDDINSRYMYCSTFHRKKLVNGYSGVMPRYWEPLVDIMKTFPSREAIKTMSIFQVSYVAVHFDSYQPEERERLRAAVEARPELQRVWSDSSSALYRFVPPAESQASTRSESVYPVPREGWKVEAVPDKGFMEGAGNLVDGRLRSYWTNGRAVRKGDCITVDMGESRRICGFCLFQGTDFGFYLRTYHLEGSKDGKSWELLASGYYDPPPFLTFFQSPHNPYFFISFPAADARFVRMRATDDGNYPWTVHEIEIYSPVSAGRPAETLIPAEHRNSTL